MDTGIIILLVALVAIVLFYIYFKYFGNNNNPKPDYQSNNNTNATSQNIKAINKQFLLETCLNSINNFANGFNCLDKTEKYNLQIIKDINTLFNNYEYHYPYIFLPTESKEILNIRSDILHKAVSIGIYYIFALNLEFSESEKFNIIDTLDKIIQNETLKVHSIFDTNDYTKIKMFLYSEIENNNE